MATKLCKFLILNALLTGSAFATTLTVSSLDSARGEFSVWLKLDDVEKEEYYAGAINIAVDHTYTRTAFCIDLFTNIGFADYDTDLSAPGNQTRLQRIGWLIENELPSVLLSSQGAGLQVAIWDIVHDGGDGLSTGRIQAVTTNATSPLIVTAANTFLAASKGKGSQLAVIYTNSQNGVPAQRLVSDTTFDGGPHVATPEGSSLSLMLSGLGACMVGVIRRRFRSSAIKTR